MQTYNIDIRSKRQATFPKQLLDQLGVSVGDSFVAKNVGNKLVLAPKKQVALDALKEIQRAFMESGIPEKDMQGNLKKIRREIYEKRYAQNIPR